MRMGFMAALAMSALSTWAMAPVSMTKDSGTTPYEQTASKKAKRAAKRVRFGSANFPKWPPRTRNAPPKRKLRRNLVTHSRRVRRKHRRAAK